LAAAALEGMVELMGGSAPWLVAGSSSSWQQQVSELQERWVLCHRGSRIAEAQFKKSCTQVRVQVHVFVNKKKSANCPWSFFPAATVTLVLSITFVILFCTSRRAAGRQAWLSHWLEQHHQPVKLACAADIYHQILCCRGGSTPHLVLLTMFFPSLLPDAVLYLLHLLQGCGAPGVAEPLA
jgi:hypothetical protein